MGITRFSSLAGRTGDVTVGTSAANSDPIVFSELSGGMMSIPSGSSITKITWYAVLEEGDTYQAVNDANSTPVEQNVVGGQNYDLPPSLFGSYAVKPVGNVAGIIKVRLKG